MHVADQRGVPRDDVGFVSCHSRFFVVLMWTSSVIQCKHPHIHTHVFLPRPHTHTPTHPHTHTPTHMTDPGAVTFGKWVVPAHLQSVLWVHVDACLDRGVRDDVQDAEQRMLSTLARRLLMINHMVHALMETMGFAPPVSVQDPVRVPTPVPVPGTTDVEKVRKLTAMMWKVIRQTVSEVVSRVRAMRDVLAACVEGSRTEDDEAVHCLSVAVGVHEKWANLLLTRLAEGTAAMGTASRTVVLQAARLLAPCFPDQVKAALAGAGISRQDYVAAVMTVTSLSSVLAEAWPDVFFG